MTIYLSKIKRGRLSEPPPLPENDKKPVPPGGQKMKQDFIDTRDRSMKIARLIRDNPVGARGAIIKLVQAQKYCCGIEEDYFFEYITGRLNREKLVGSYVYIAKQAQGISRIVG